MKILHGSKFCPQPLARNTHMSTYIQTWSNIHIIFFKIVGLCLNSLIRESFQTTLMIETEIIQWPGFSKWDVKVPYGWGAALNSGLHVWLVMWRSWSSSPIKAPPPPVVSLSKKLYPYCSSTGWFQERIRAWIHNRTKINWGSYGRLD